MHTTEYLGFGKGLLATRYLRVYITNSLSVYKLQRVSCLKWSICLDFYIFEDSSDLENLPLFIKHWMNFNSPVLFPWWRTYAQTVTSQKYLCYLLDWKPFRNDEKCFLFHLKSTSRSQGIQVFVMTFWSCRENGLIRKIKSTSKFMTSQPGLKTIATHILSNISQSKVNQIMKFGQLI